MFQYNNLSILEFPFGDWDIIGLLHSKETSFPFLSEIQRNQRLNVRSKSKKKLPGAVSYGRKYIIETINLGYEYGYSI